MPSDVRCLVVQYLTTLLEPGIFTIGRHLVTNSTYADDNVFIASTTTELRRNSKAVMCISSSSDYENEDAKERIIGILH